MPALVRSISKRGPKFYRVGDELLFVLHIDSSTQVGPRAATREDAEEHPEAWAQFVEEQTVEGKAREHDVTPFSPMVTFETPEGGEPIKEIGPHAAKRAKAAAEGVKA